MTKRQIEIENWNAEGAVPTSSPAAHESRVTPAKLGLIGTAVLHGLVFQSFVYGTRAPRIRPPETQGVGATLVKSTAPPSDTLILVDLPRASMSEAPLAEDLASAGPKPTPLLVTLLSPDRLPHVDIPEDAVRDATAADAAVDSGDPAARAMLFGRYMGQIDARIERVWRRPRSAINAWRGTDSVKSRSNDAKAVPEPRFACQVRVLQDNHGTVQEVQMLSCNGSAVWQQSIVAAIFAASPLPAAPNPSVFTQSLTMTFTAAEYTSSSAADDYEAASSLSGRTANNEQ